MGSIWPFAVVSVVGAIVILWTAHLVTVWHIVSAFVSRLATWPYTALVGACVVVCLALNWAFQPIGGQVSRRRLSAWLALNVTLLVAASLLPGPWQIVTAASVVSVNLLTVATKVLMLVEDERLAQAAVELEAARFRRYQGAVPIQVVLVVPFIILVGLAILLQGLDEGSPGLGFAAHDGEVLESYVGSLTMVLWDVLMNVLVLPPLSTPVFPVRLTLEPYAWLSMLMMYALYLTFILLAYNALRLNGQLTWRIDGLIEGLQGAKPREHIELLQRLARVFPTRAKQKLIDLALNGPNALARRRAIAAVRYVGVRNFVFPFLRGLHREPSPKNRMYGLHRVLLLLASEKYDQRDRDYLRVLVRRQQAKGSRHPAGVLRSLERIRLAL